MLEQLKNPSDIKNLDQAELSALCDEIRARLIEVVSKNGGHLASNLGCVELSVAMHLEFDSPKDTMLFDVGHQSYVHKLLTGRNDRFDTIRKYGGLSGFMNPDESEHDGFISGHSSNSISAALGIATAKKLSGDSSYTVAVIGDGALTGGMAFEGLNNAAEVKPRLIVILNDNKMSISHNVGAFARHLQSLRMRSSYIRAKTKVKNHIVRWPGGRLISQMLSKMKNFTRRVLLGDNIFESIGFEYFGPVDGHSIADVRKALRSAKQESGPVVVHVCTTKGKGYSFAEQNPMNFHGISAFDISTGSCSASKPNYSACFGSALCELAAEDKRICAITAAMAEGTGLDRFRSQFPDRFFDVGIAEQHAVTFAAGLAHSGMIPVFAVYSSFLQRAYDQILHDAAICNEHIVLCVDRAGVVGDDGVTHQGMFDVSLFNSIPGVTVLAPSDYCQLRSMLKRAVYDINGVVAIRYPRGCQCDGFEQFFDDSSCQIIGSGSCAVVAYGRTVIDALAAADGLAAVCKLNQIKPIDLAVFDSLMGYDSVIVLEEGIRSGGVGSVIAAGLAERGYLGRFVHRAVDNFVEKDSVDGQLLRLGLDADSIRSLILEVQNG